MIFVALGPVVELCPTGMGGPEVLHRNQHPVALGGHEFAGCAGRA
jgi:hypothetical protein